jgi:DNA-binding LacI/PurR family transcriptional regulator
VATRTAVNTRLLAARESNNKIVVSPHSVKLFTAWAAKHKQVLEIEDQWEIAVRDNHASADALRQQLTTARQEAERMLSQAQAVFHEELKERGIRQ